jgi:hypothetical protein
MIDRHRRDPHSSSITAQSIDNSRPDIACRQTTTCFVIESRLTVVRSVDLADMLFISDAERAASEWLLARERDPAATAPTSEIAPDYAQIEGLLDSLPSGPADGAWRAQLLRAASAAPRRSRASVWVFGGAIATATTAIAVWLLLPRAPLVVATHHAHATRGAPDEVAVGDQLVVTARPRKAGNLRVYRSDGRLIARCPNGPGCRAGSHGEQTIEITLDAPARYDVILVDDVSDALPDGAKDVYVDAANAARACVIKHSIDVH